MKFLDLLRLKIYFLKLKKTYQQVFYWQEIHQGEVDFVVLEGQKITPYQVSWEEREPRHERALHYFYESFPQASEAVFINRYNAAEFLNV